MGIFLEGNPSGHLNVYENKQENSVKFPAPGSEALLLPGCDAFILEGVPRSFTGLSASVKRTRGCGVPGPACALHADRSSRTFTGAGVTHVVRLV